MNPAHSAAVQPAGNRRHAAAWGCVNDANEGIEASSLLFRLRRVVCGYSRACAPRNMLIHTIGCRVGTSVGRYS